jgi:hypothetical protein
VLARNILIPQVNELNENHFVNQLFLKPLFDVITKEVSYKTKGDDDMTSYARPPC